MYTVISEKTATKTCRKERFPEHLSWLRVKPSSPLPIPLISLLPISINFRQVSDSLLVQLKTDRLPSKGRRLTKSFLAFKFLRKNSTKIEAQASTQQLHWVFFYPVSNSLKLPEPIPFSCFSFTRTTHLRCVWLPHCSSLNFVRAVSEPKYRICCR